MGRNLLVYQRIEHVLKDLLFLAGLTASSADPPDHEARMRGKLQRRTLGCLSAALSSLPSASDRCGAGPGQGDATVVYFGYEMSDPAGVAAELALLVAARNRLVHGFLHSTDLSTPQARLAAAESLDGDYGSASRLLDRLLAKGRRVRRGLLEALSFLESPAGLAELMVPELRASDLTLRLAAAASELRDPDGWASLRHACRRIREDIPCLVDGELRRLGMASVTELLLASRAFEVRPQPSEGGGSRILYRPVD